jgi:transcriptional regulator with XRE-family HTH domain
MSFGQRLKQIRESKNLDINTCANQCGITPSTYRQIENGKIKNPPEKRLRLIADTLNIPIEEIHGQINSIQIAPPAELTEIEIHVEQEMKTDIHIHKYIPSGKFLEILARRGIISSTYTLHVKSIVFRDRVLTLTKETLDFGIQKNFFSQQQKNNVTQIYTETGEHIASISYNISDLVSSKKEMFATYLKYTKNKWVDSFIETVVEALEHRSIRE